jgi:site-specific DNA-methyltransferase (adenine-specific)
MVDPWRERWVSECGRATCYLGDNREVWPTLPTVDHVITDPPYGDVTHKGARTGKNGGETLVTFDAIEAAYLQLACREWLLKTRRWVLFTCEWRHAACLEAAGLPLVRLGVWVKPNGAPQFTGDRPGTGWEAVALLHNEGRKRWNGGGHHAVWTYSKTEGLHPTQKPMPLLLRWVGDFTDEGETIADPFMGSGTTGAAALRLGRRFVGIEIEEGYFRTACRRIAEAARQPDLLIAETHA